MYSIIEISFRIAGIIADLGTDIKEVSINRLSIYKVWIFPEMVHQVFGRSMPQGPVENKKNLDFSL
jgi:hypothetical protein